MDLEPAVRADILAAIPRLRAFAISLCRNSDRADDLVQETMLRAYANVASFRAGGNLMGWLVTILRNQFYSEYRRRRREVEDGDGSHAETLATAPDQLTRLEREELRAAIARLPDDMREALDLVVGSGLSYEDAAKLRRCPVGTIKSRVSRARVKLAAMLSLEVPAELFEDAIPHTVVIAGEHRRYQPAP
jgi:RNA polymerase sigma-70 factor (ECF subfamily)